MNVPFPHQIAEKQNQIIAVFTAVRGDRSWIASI
jgi:hypothetical protein